MVSLRDCVQELIALQMDPATPDSAKMCIRDSIEKLLKSGLAERRAFRRRICLVPTDKGISHSDPDR